MNRILFIILSYIPIMVTAAPFATTLPNMDTIQPTFCGVYVDTLPKVEIAVLKDANGKAYCKYDVGNLPAVPHTVKFTYIVKDPVWATLESGQSTPFTLARPALPTTPVGLALIP